MQEINFLAKKLALINKRTYEKISVQFRQPLGAGRDTIEGAAADTYGARRPEARVHVEARQPEQYL
jgi:hypothetical protein